MSWPDFSSQRRDPMGWPELYQSFQNWRVRLYEQLVQQTLTTDELLTLIGDLGQASARIEAEIKRQKAAPKSC